MAIFAILTGCLVITVACLIRAEFSGRKGQIYFFKPVSTLLIITVIALSFWVNDLSAAYKTAILIGMLFCLGGDIALMFDSARAFMAGLVSFLIGHVVYTAAFLHFGGYLWFDFPVTPIVALASIAMFIYLYPGLQKMKGPVLAYVLVITLMLNCAALSFKSDFFTPSQARFLAIGAALFYLSDVILAINRFRAPFKLNRISLAFYFSGQLLIAFSTHLSLSL